MQWNILNAITNSLHCAPLIDFPYAHPAVQDSWPSCSNCADASRSWIPACQHSAPKERAMPCGEAALPRDVKNNEAMASLQFLKDLFIWIGLLKMSPTPRATSLVQLELLSEYLPLSIKILWYLFCNWKLLLAIVWCERLAPNWRFQLFSASQKKLLNKTAAVELVTSSPTNSYQRTS